MDYGWAVMATGWEGLNSDEGVDRVYAVAVYHGIDAEAQAKQHVQKANDFLQEYLKWCYGLVTPEKDAKVEELDRLWKELDPFGVMCMYETISIKYQAVRVPLVVHLDQFMEQADDRMLELDSVEAEDAYPTNNPLNGVLDWDPDGEDAAGIPDMNEIEPQE
jgi:hypothetical protein